MSYTISFILLLCIVVGCYLLGRYGELPLMFTASHVLQHVVSIKMKIENAPGIMLLQDVVEAV